MALLAGEAAARLLDYERLEVASSGAETSAELLAIPGPGARPASNWLAAATPYFTRDDVAAVVVPTLTPDGASLAERGAAAVLESRLGGGSRRSRYFPGNVHITHDHVADSLVVRRADFLAAQADGIERADLVGWLAERGRLTIYTPDTLIASAPPALLGPHLRGTLSHAAVRGTAARRRRGRNLGSATLLPLVPALGAVVGALLVVFGSPDARLIGIVLVTAYVAIVAASALLAALRFRSLRVGLLATLAIPLTQAAYAFGFARGVLRPR